MINLSYYYGGGSGAAPAFTPASVTSAGLVLWLKADAGVFQDAAGTTPATAASDPVGHWHDQSGAGHHATQSSAGARPALAAAAVNGLPALTFDGSGTFLNVPSLTSQTIFVVVNHTDGATFTNYRRVLDCNNGGGGGAGWTVYGNNGDTTYYDTAFDVSHGHFYINGVLHAEASPSAAPLASYRLLSGVGNDPSTFGISVGTLLGIGAQVLLGHVAEVIIYDGPLSADDRVGVEGYCNTRYALW